MFGFDMVEFQALPVNYYGLSDAKLLIFLGCAQQNLNNEKNYQQMELSLNSNV